MRYRVMGSLFIMDDYLGDEFSDGMRLRPATLCYALKNYPKVIVWLYQGILNVNYVPSADGNDIVSVSGPNRGIEHWTMVLSDFEKCKKIANEITIPLFPFTQMLDFEKIVCAYIKVEFGS